MRKTCTDSLPVKKIKHYHENCFNLPSTSQVVNGRRGRSEQISHQFVAIKY